MKPSVAPRLGRGLVTVLSVGICVAAVVLVWLGYEGNRRWGRGVTALAERSAAETADLMQLALGRDMRGVQRTVLESSDWDLRPSEDSPDVRNVAASAFARYPYPESFFTWRVGAPPAAVVFLMRTERRPPWIAPDERAGAFPVVTGASVNTAERLLDRIRPDLAAGKPYSVFSLSVGGVTYHVVARLVYADLLRLKPESVAGFLVNLDWARRVYFPEMAAQIARLRPEHGVPVAIVDDRGALVAGARFGGNGTAKVSRAFPLLFCDPMIVAADSTLDIPRAEWTIEADATPNPTLAAAIRNANRTLVGSVVAVAMLGLGLLLTARALRSGARLAQMRSDFVSTVTHELKTPIATIRAAGDTLAQGRVGDPDKQRTYADLVVRESKRLSRLVDNILAWARITAEEDIYSRVPVDPAALVDDVLSEFHRALSDAGFAVEVDAEADLPSVRGDRTALHLALANLVDNAMRYSADRRSLRIALRRDGPAVSIEIADRGVGIPPEDLERVRKRFVRGTSARSSGSGLGLAIADRVVADHGGTLAMRSAVGLGTTVTISLPISETDDAEADPRR